MNFLIHVRLGSCHQLPSEIVYFRAVEQQFSSINGDGQADDAPGSLYRSVNGEDLKVLVHRVSKEGKENKEKIVLPMSFNQQH